MGAPKQKWTSEEEGALKAGIAKHGPGKWRTILKDPEFSGVLALRSNVDLKDKWRNMNVTANGWGSRERARLAIKRGQQLVKLDENTMSPKRVVPSDEEILDAKPISSSNGLLQIAAPKQSISRLEDLILEAIINLKEPSGSNKTAITLYIEDKYEAPLNFKSILSAKLKGLTASGKLIKVKRKYRIAPCGPSLEVRKSSAVPTPSPTPTPTRIPTSTPTRIPTATATPTPTPIPTATPEAKQRDPPRVGFSKSQIDAELAKIRTMSAKEAAKAAARAVAEAEAAIVEAEQAAREAEEAEADAEVARAFAEAAKKALKTRSIPNLMVHG